MMKVLRTPEARFDGLVGYEFSPHFVDIRDADGSPLRIHYVDEGPRAAPVALLVHGEPTWSYLYRGLIRRLCAAGLRVVAPDLIGFGRSDKPAEVTDYTYQRHVDWLSAFVGALELSSLRLALHDWGGLIGLRLVAQAPALFNRVLLSNTTLPIGERGPPAEFLRFRERLRQGKWLSAGALIEAFHGRALLPGVRDAYDAPFPDLAHQAGLRAFPELLPTSVDDPASLPNREAWQALSRFERPLLTLYAGNDPLTLGAERPFINRVPGARGQPHRVLPGAGHFIQEEQGDAFNDAALAFLSRS